MPARTRRLGGERFLYRIACCFVLAVVPHILLSFLCQGAVHGCGGQPAVQEEERPRLHPVRAAFIRILASFGVSWCVLIAARCDAGGARTLSARPSRSMPSSTRSSRACTPAGCPPARWAAIRLHLVAAACLTLAGCGSCGIRASSAASPSRRRTRRWKSGGRSPSTGRCRSRCVCKGREAELKRSMQFSTQRLCSRKDRPHERTQNANGRTEQADFETHW